MDSILRFKKIINYLWQNYPAYDPASDTISHKECGNFYLDEERTSFWFSEFPKEIYPIEEFEIFAEEAVIFLPEDYVLDRLITSKRLSERFIKFMLKKPDYFDADFLERVKLSRPDLVNLL